MSDAMQTVRLSVGQTVSVNMGRRGGVQSGTVTKVLPDGRFVWKNRCNFERTSKASQITADPEREGKLDPYMAAWAAEGDGES